MKKESWEGFEDFKVKIIHPLMVELKERVTKEKDKLKSLALAPKVLSILFFIAWGVGHFAKVELTPFIPQESTHYYLFSAIVFAIVWMRIKKQAVEVSNANIEIMEKVFGFRGWSYQCPQNSELLLKNYYQSESPIRQILKAELGFSKHYDGFLGQAKHKIYHHIQSEEFVWISLRSTARYQSNDNEEQQEKSDVYFKGLCIDMSINTEHVFALYSKNFLGTQSRLDERQLIERYQLPALVLPSQYADNFIVLTKTQAVEKCTAMIDLLSQLSEQLKQIRNFAVYSDGTTLFLVLNFNSSVFSNTLIETPKSIDELINQSKELENICTELRKLV